MTLRADTFGPNGGGGHTNTQNGRDSGEVRPPTAKSPGPRYRRTATGIAISLDGVTIDADHVSCNDYRTRALVSVRWREQLCHRQWINLEDARQREGFVATVKLSCRQAGTTDGTPPAIVADRVTPRLLLQLAEQCRSRESALTNRSIGRARRRVLRRRARILLHSRRDVLSRLATAMRATGYAGKLEPAVLAYVALTSRVLEECPINLALVGEPAAGKNATLDAALAFVPPEAVYTFTASSPTAMVYANQEFRHRVVIFREADSIPDRGPAAAAIRALTEVNMLRYEVTIRGPRTGSLETWLIEKAGPTGLITTSIRPLAPQLYTRLLPVYVVNNDDRLTTYQVILAKADRASRRLPPLDVEPFLAFQRWLANAGGHRVIVPFARALARAMGECSLELRTRRDFGALLSCVKTIALLRQRHRQRAVPGGEIEATTDDYRLARELLIDSFSKVAAEGLSAAIRELVEKITEKEEITRVELGERLPKPRSTLYYQVAKALELELLTEERRSGKRFLRRNGPLPHERLPLPEVEEVEGFFFGVPAPPPIRPRPTPPDVITCFKEFLSDFSKTPQGFTAAEWATRVGHPVDVIRRRLDALVRSGTLIYDPHTMRYVLS